MNAPSREWPPARTPTTGIRMRYRADVAVAARIVAPSWPLSTFIAVNPLGGLEQLPFEAALTVAGDFYGTRGMLSEPHFRELHAAGRITAADLAGALHRRLGTVDRTLLALGDSTLTPLQLLIADLRVGVPAALPKRRMLTRAEQEDVALAARIDGHCAKWCAAYCDGGQAAFTLPGREAGLYASWRRMAGRDRSLPASVRAYLAGLPESAEAAALSALSALGVSLAQRIPYLQAHLTRQPGWAGHLRWRADHRRGDELVDYLTIRLSYEAAFLTRDEGPTWGPWQPAQPEAAEPDDAKARACRIAWSFGIAEATEGQLSVGANVLKRLPCSDRLLVWLDAYESHYRDGFLQRLSSRPVADTAKRPAAQAVFCIDVRSEGMRRHLETQGDYQTLGFAGFFAAAVSFTDLAGGDASALCPVLLEPKNAVREIPADTMDSAAQRRLAGLQAASGARDGFHDAKENALAPFALAEIAGWFAGPVAAAKTFVPRHFGALRKRLSGAIAPSAATSLTVGDGFTFEERCLLAKAALTMMGLTSNVARLVMLCGHGSSTENNPYASALDCGACGGNRGAANARVAAAIFNEQAVREHLAAEGIVIPADTWFVAAEHDTAVDTVQLLDEWLVPPSHQADLAQLLAATRAAGKALSAERCATLPGAAAHARAQHASRHVRRRSADWGQVFPEWGLAGNAAFIVAPRSLTAGLNLERRTFLHSYEADADPDGAALETILTAPLVVAQWINCQYYFSAVDPDCFGAGTKTIHNAVGGIGVLSGPSGDLRVGLARQSVRVGDDLVHEPMRLLAIVQAPLSRIDQIIARNGILQNLIGNAWVALAAREDESQPWQRRTSRAWEPWSTSEEARMSEASHES